MTKDKEKKVLRTIWVLSLKEDTNLSRFFIS